MVTTNPNASIEQLIAEYSSQKFHDNFVVTGRGPGNTPSLYPAGNIALDAVNLARRLKNQQGYTDVTIWQWDDEVPSKNWKGSKKYVVADGSHRPPNAKGEYMNYMAKAFPTKTGSTPNGDVQFKREAAMALGLFETRVRTVKANRTFSDHERAMLVQEFLIAMHAIGGSNYEILDAVEASAETVEA